jgi:hypothetical protein
MARTRIKIAVRLGRICVSWKSSPKGFPDDVERGEKQQAGLDKCRKILDFAVAIEVIRICRLVSHPHGKIGDDGGDKIEYRMQRFGENSQAPGRNRQERLQAHQHDRGTHRTERRHPLLACCFVECHRAKFG